MILHDTQKTLWPAGSQGQSPQLSRRCGEYPVNSAAHCPGKLTVVRLVPTATYRVVITHQSVRRLGPPSCRAFNERLLHIPASGYRNTNGNANNADYNGYNWSGSSGSTTNAWYLNVNSTNSNRSNTNRQNGFPVRCIRAFTGPAGSRSYYSRYTD